MCQWWHKLTFSIRNGFVSFKKEHTGGKQSFSIWKCVCLMLLVRIFQDWIRSGTWVCLFEILSCYVVWQVTCTNSLNHEGKQRSRWRFSFRIASASISDTTNECKLGVFYSCISHRQISVSCAETGTSAMCGWLYVSSGCWTSDVIKTPEWLEREGIHEKKSDILNELQISIFLFEAGKGGTTREKNMAATWIHSGIRS